MQVIPSAMVGASAWAGVTRVGVTAGFFLTDLGSSPIVSRTVAPKLAAARQIDAGEQEEARRLAAAGRAEKRDELAVVDRQVHVGNDFDVPEPLDDVAELDPCHRRQPFTPPIDICIRYRCAAT